MVEFGVEFPVLCGEPLAPQLGPASGIFSEAWVVPGHFREHHAGEKGWAALQVLTFRTYIARTVIDHRQYVQIILFRKHKSPLVEAYDVSVEGPGRLGEYGYGIALLYLASYLFRHSVKALSGIQEVAVAHYRSEQGIAEDPSLGNHHQFRSKSYEHYHVQQGLVVGYYHSRPAVHILLTPAYETHGRDYPYEVLAEAVTPVVEEILFPSFRKRRNAEQAGQYVGDNEAADEYAPDPDAVQYAWQFRRVEMF